MSQNSNSNINILVVDDDREIAQAIEIYLRNEGYNVFKAYDGLEAVNIALQRRPAPDNHGHHDA